MSPFTIYELAIKNMVCSRCLKVIRQELEGLGVEVLELELGKLKFKFPNNKITLMQIKAALEKDEFEIATNKEEKMAEMIKLILLETVNNLPIDRQQKLSVHLSKELKKDYWSLSKAFSKNEEVTIEQYFIRLRIEKAKELIEYNELNFSEIAYELGYSSISNLSRQFKQVSEMSMTEYKQLDNRNRIPLNKITQTLPKIGQAGTVNKL